MIYHLFGHHARSRSLVITEDDYFDFLIGVTRDKDLVPVSVRRGFADRALCSSASGSTSGTSVCCSEASWTRRAAAARDAHVAVQIDPEEGRSMEPGRARRFLDSTSRAAT